MKTIISSMWAAVYTIGVRMAAILLDVAAYAAKRGARDAVKKPTVPFGESIRYVRINASKTMMEVSTALGISVPHLSDIEHNRQEPLSEEMIQKFCWYIGCYTLQDALVDIAKKSKAYFGGRNVYKHTR